MVPFCEQYLLYTQITIFCKTTVLVFVFEWSTKWPSCLVISVRPSAHISAAATGRISANFFQFGTF
jgi:hypothetical protein